MNHTKVSIAEDENVDTLYVEPESIDETQTGSVAVSTSKRVRKRRLDLNSCFSVSNYICSESYCGITLPDQESLNHHYEQHVEQELQKLKNIRIKKTPHNSEVEDLRNARREALEKIKTKREDRNSRRAAGSRIDPSNEGFTECPVCGKHIIEDFGDNLRDHFAACVRSKHTETTDDFIDVDDEDYEEYEWAGQKRIRSTSLFKGGLKAAGFLTIKKTREDEVLDVTGDDEEIGEAQYNDTDLLRIEDEILDNPEEQSASNGRQLTPSSTVEKLEKSESTSTNISDQHSNTMCKICMSPYSSPLTSTTCWHVHCEKCWMLALGSKKLCPQCKTIVTPGDLRKIYL